MREIKKRIGAIERRLGIKEDPGITTVVFVYPPKPENETDEEYQARMSTAERLPGEPGEPVRYGKILKLC